MTEIDVTILQRRVETLIARVEIMGQDVATLRHRMEEIGANVQLETESLRAHLIAVLDGQARVMAMLEKMAGYKLD